MKPCTARQVDMLPYELRRSHWADHVDSCTNNGGVVVVNTYTGPRRLSKRLFIGFSIVSSINAIGATDATNTGGSRASVKGCVPVLTENVVFVE